jgi:hypothetical protein
LSEVQIVMKTGVAERERMEAFLETFGSCIPNILIVSDASYAVGGHQAIDVLADLPDFYAHDNPDWAIYAEQREMLQNAGEKKPEKSPAGWKLDRFKFLPMVEKAYETSPHAKWFVFIEADIYYFWDSLFRLLETLDPQQHHYLGSATAGSEWFAYGGGGMILSGTLVHDLLDGGRRALSAVPKYQKWVQTDCCGDAVLAYVISAELGVHLRSLYPMIPGEELHELKVTPRKWCLPLLGLHRVSPDLMRRLWRWERCRPPTAAPITYAAFLNFLLTPLLRRGAGFNWSNGAETALPEGGLAHESPSMCRTACAQEPACLGYSYAPGKCSTADFIVEGSDAPGVFSGWDLGALRELGYVSEGDPGGFCGRAEWVVPYDPDKKVQW